MAAKRSKQKNHQYCVGAIALPILARQVEFDLALPPLFVSNSKHSEFFICSHFHKLPPVIILKWQLAGGREKKTTMILCFILSTSDSIQ